MGIFTPSNQVKLTNVSIVRLKKGGKRFELACYKNKVMEWRNQVETDLDNVLQISHIFTNVSKGELAAKEELEKCFKTDDENKIVLEILKKGELQVGEKEREAQLDSLHKDIATTVSEKCINPETKRPYPVTMIEKAMSDVHFSINPHRSAKQQALELIKTLQEKQIIPIARAQMKVRISLPSKDGKRIKDKLKSMIATVEDEDWGEQWELNCLINPGSFKTINELLQQETKGKGHLEVLNVRHVTEGDETI